MLIQDLQAGLKKALSGDVETLLLELLMPPLEFEANRLQQAMVVRLPALSSYIYVNIIIHIFMMIALLGFCRVWAPMRKHWWRSCAPEQGSSFRTLLPHTTIVMSKVPIWKQAKATLGLPAARWSHCLRFSSVLKKDLEKELKGETSGDFSKLVLALLHVRVWSNTFHVYMRLIIFLRKLTFFNFCRQKEAVTAPVQRDIEVRFGIKLNISDF